MRVRACVQPDELHKICCVMGTPTAATWPEGLQLAQQVGGGGGGSGGGAAAVAAAAGGGLPRGSARPAP